jgi:anti-anti-sigma regulatory factor
VPSLLDNANVECRIHVQQQPDGCTIHLAGRLNAAQVHELRSACAAADGPIRIDLTDLLSADAVGLDALQRLKQAGAEIVGAAQYLRRWVT